MVKLAKLFLFQSQDLRTEDGKSITASVVTADETSLPDDASLSTVISGDQTNFETTSLMQNFSSQKLSDADQTLENDSVANCSAAQFATELLLSSTHQPSPSFSGYESNSHESDAELKAHESIAESINRASSAHEAKAHESSCAHDSIGHESDSLVSDGCESSSQESNACGSNAHQLDDAHESVSFAHDELQPSVDAVDEDGGRLLNGRAGSPLSNPKDSHPLHHPVIESQRTTPTFKANDNAFSCSRLIGPNGLSSTTMTHVLAADMTSLAQQPCLRSCTNNQVTNSRNDCFTSEGGGSRPNASKKSSISSYFSVQVCMLQKIL